MLPKSNVLIDIYPCLNVSVDKKKDFQNANVLIFLISRKAAVVQGISMSEWCLRSQVRSTLCSHFAFFHAEYRGKIPEVLKTAEARHVFIPFSHGKYFPVVDLCRPASSCVCTGISLSVL